MEESKYLQELFLNSYLSFSDFSISSLISFSSLELSYSFDFLLEIVWIWENFLMYLLFTKYGVISTRNISHKTKLTDLFKFINAD